MSIIHIEDGERVQIARLAIDQLTIRDGYPRLGNIVGMVSDYLKREKKVTKPLVMLGTLPNQITFRAADETAFNYPYVQQLVASKVPLSFVEGGGHPHAGTFRFAESQYKAVWEVVHEYLRGL
jgi:RecJ-like exonuclease